MFMGPKYSVLYFKENLMQRKNQMNDRLQKMLLKKYALTKNQRYLAWLEPVPDAYFHHRQSGI